MLPVQQLSVAVKLIPAEGRAHRRFEGRVAGVFRQIPDQCPHLFMLGVAQGLHNVRKFCRIFFDPSDLELVVGSVEPLLRVLNPEVA